MWTLQDAKNRFSSVVAAALAGQPQAVSRRGKPAVVVLSAQEYQRLLAEAGSVRESFAEHLLAFPGDRPQPAVPLPRAQVRLRDVTF